MQGSIRKTLFWTSTIKTMNCVSPFKVAMLLLDEGGFTEKGLHLQSTLWCRGCSYISASAAPTPHHKYRRSCGLRSSPSAAGHFQPSDVQQRRRDDWPALLGSARAGYGGVSSRAGHWPWNARHAEPGGHEQRSWSGAGALWSLGTSPHSHGARRESPGARARRLPPKILEQDLWLPPLAGTEPSTTSKDYRAEHELSGMTAPDRIGASHPMCTPTAVTLLQNKTLAKNRLHKRKCRFLGNWTGS